MKNRFLLVSCVTAALGIGLACLSFIARSHRAAVQVSDSIFDDTMVNLSWPEVKRAADEGAIVLLPVAVIEEHGPHMKLGVDVRLGHLYCRLAKTNLESKGIRTLIAPPFYWGINNCTGSFPGSFSSKSDTMKLVLHDVFASLKKCGFQKVFIVNTHGDSVHRNILGEAISESRDALKMDIKQVGPSRWPPVEAVYKGLDIHAGASETSCMAAYFPGQVDEKLARTLKPQNSDLTGWSGDAALKLTPLGYVGNPAG